MRAVWTQALPISRKTKQILSPTTSLLSYQGTAPRLCKVRKVPLTVIAHHDLVKMQCFLLVENERTDIEALKDVQVLDATNQRRNNQNATVTFISQHQVRWTWHNKAIVAQFRLVITNYIPNRWEIQHNKGKFPDLDEAETVAGDSNQLDGHWFSMLRQHGAHSSSLSANGRRRKAFGVGLVGCGYCHCRHSSVLVLEWPPEWSLLDTYW